jgi:hypothetical protein
MHTKAAPHRARAAGSNRGMASAMNVNVLLAVAAVAASCAFGTAVAHHSFAAEFDADDPVEVTGTVTNVNWANPHVFFYIDVENEEGLYDNWAVELASPNGLMRRGWTRNSLQLGDEVTVAGSRARDGSFKANARSVVLSTGQRLFAGSSQGVAEE